MATLVSRVGLNRTADHRTDIQRSDDRGRVNIEVKVPTLFGTGLGSNKRTAVALALMLMIAMLRGRVIGRNVCGRCMPLVAVIVLPAAACHIARTMRPIRLISLLVRHASVRMMPAAAEPQVKQEHERRQLWNGESHSTA